MVANLRIRPQTLHRPYRAFPVRQRCGERLIRKPFSEMPPFERCIIIVFID
jgi:hypothetical protein